MTACPRCGFHSNQPAPPENKAPRRDLARVGSVAEAGYLVSLLESAGLAASTRPVESFNAVTGAWSATHTVSVAEGDLEIATALLRAESRGQNLEAALAAGAVQETQPASSVNPWRMLAVLTAVVAAGAFMSWDTLGDEEAVRRPLRGVDADLPGEEPESLLAAALRQQPGPFYSSDKVAGGRSRLAFSARTQEWTLSVDRDHDGRYETHRRFAVTQPVAAAASER